MASASLSRICSRILITKPIILQLASACAACRAVATLCPAPFFIVSSLATQMAAAPLSVVMMGSCHGQVDLSCGCQLVGCMVVFIVEPWPKGWAAWPPTFQYAYQKWPFLVTDNKSLDSLPGSGLLEPPNNLLDVTGHVCPPPVQLSFLHSQFSPPLGNKMVSFDVCCYSGVPKQLDGFCDLVVK
jgi:hypothetical protein